MNELKRHMIIKAREQYSSIVPCSTKDNLTDCFTVENGRLLFWFNTEDHSTYDAKKRLEIDLISVCQLDS